MPSLNWDVEVLPSGPTDRGGAELAIDAYGIARTTEVADASWQLVKFLTSPEAAKLYARYGFLVPRKSVLEEVFTDPDNPNSPPSNWRCIYSAIDTSESIPRSPNFIEIAIDVIQPEFDLMTSGKQSPEQAAQRATNAANAYIRVLSTR
jgi:ABC-type glycerol-3-phosphate transport system substrate-binding protein